LSLAVGSGSAWFVTIFNINFGSQSVSIRNLWSIQFGLVNLQSYELNCGVGELLTVGQMEKGNEMLGCADVNNYNNEC